MLVLAALGFGQDLKLAVGDVVEIVVTAPSLSSAYSGDFAVQSDGSIYGVGFGRLLVAQHTIPEAQRLLRQSMNRLVKPEEVFLTLKSEVARRVFVIGASNATAGGSVEIVGSLGLRQALSGMVAAKDADLLEARVFRAGSQILKVNVADLLNGRSVTGDLPLEPNDIISVALTPTVRVWVAGSVRNPGPQLLPESASIDQAVAQAGGADLPSTADALAFRGEYRILLRRGTTLTEFPLSANPSALAVGLESGDTVTVMPPVRNRIVVAGEVKTPGELVTRPGETLVEAVARAGGVTAEGSAAEAIVYRAGEPTVVNADVNSERQTGTKFQLQDGDTVLIRKNDRVVYVFGEILHQGKVSVPTGKVFRVTDALAQSGGLSQTGTLRRVYLARVGPDGHYAVREFNLDEFIKDGKLSSNPELEPGDVLLFGQPKPTFLSAVTQVVGSLLFLDTIAGAAGFRTTVP
jgi:protein involved in polysaccharide export with SLBB domain